LINMSEITPEQACSSSLIKVENQSIKFDGGTQWRGNCSGFIYKDIFERLKPKVFVDPMVGSGTSVEVAKEMGILAFGLDLHSGFNALRDSIVQAVGQEASLVLSHPPYGAIIKYSGPGGMWGQDAHPDDLSHAIDDEDFHAKLQAVLMNQRQATLPGGYYGTIIGDMRKNGKYVSYQAEAIARMPAAELASVMIKIQHNTVSERKTYGNIALPFITHEYIVLWKKAESSIFGVLKSVACQAQSRLTGTWKNVVKQVLIEIGGKSDLQNIYASVEAKCERAAQNQHWKEKVRQVLNSHPKEFQVVERGVWSLV